MNSIENRKYVVIGNHINFGPPEVVVWNFSGWDVQFWLELILCTLYALHYESKIELRVWVIPYRVPDRSEVCSFLFRALSSLNISWADELISAGNFKLIKSVGIAFALSINCVMAIALKCLCFYKYFKFLQHNMACTLSCIR